MSYEKSTSTKTDTEGTITFEDTKGKQYNDQKKKNKEPNNYQQKTYRKQ
jgi:hypothetical protein